MDRHGLNGLNTSLNVCVKWASVKHWEKLSYSVRVTKTTAQPVGNNKIETHHNFIYSKKFSVKIDQQNTTIKQKKTEKNTFGVRKHFYISDKIRISKAFFTNLTKHRAFVWV